MQHLQHNHEYACILTTYNWTLYNENVHFNIFQYHHGINAIIETRCKSHTWILLFITNISNNKISNITVFDTFNKFWTNTLSGITIVYLHKLDRVSLNKTLI